MERISLTYGYVRSRQMEGSYNCDPSIGAWPITYSRVMRGYGNIDESVWPYDTDGTSWPPNEPPNVDMLAKKNRIFAYQRIKNLDECKLLIYYYGGVNIAVEITGLWRTARGGRIRMPDPSDSIEGSHSFLVIGYDDSTGFLKFKNSWGVNWGDKGFGSLPYKYFQEAWFLFPASVQPELRCTVNKRVINWELASPLNHLLHGIEILGDDTDERIGWTFAAEYDGYLNVEELFVMPPFRRNGWSKILLQEMVGLSETLDTPLKFWISHADTGPENMRIIYRLARRADFVVSDADVRWASFEVVKREYPAWFYQSNGHHSSKARS